MAHPFLYIEFSKVRLSRFVDELIVNKSGDSTYPPPTIAEYLNSPEALHVSIEPCLWSNERLLGEF